MGAAFPLHHRMNQSALKLEPIVSLFAQFSDRMVTKKFGTDVFLRRLTGQRFDSVLTKFEDVPVVIRTRPGAALAIETVLLVNFQPIRKSASKAALARSEFQTLAQCVHSRRDAIRFAQIRRTTFRRLHARR